MKPAAHHAAAIEVLDAVFDGIPAARAVTDWGRAHRFAGSKDRAAIADIVYTALRQRRSFGWLGGGDTAREVVIGLTRAAGTLDEVFTGTGYAPEPLSAAEVASGSALEDAPDAVRWDWPDWLMEDTSRTLGEATQEVLRAIQSRAPVDLRVNAARAGRDDVIAALANEGVETEACAEDPDAIRVTLGARRVAQTVPFKEGLIEVQDLASQCVARMAGVVPGMSVLDYCAGGGGKALAFAAHGQGSARIVAHDLSEARLDQIGPRASRARAVIEITNQIAPTERFDLVFVDAPCSGSGAWRRNPDAKWSLDAEAFDRLQQSQAGILDQAQAFVRPGGRLVYATCSILMAENAAQVSGFSARYPEFAHQSSRQLLPPAPGDGFFCASWDRQDTT